MADKTIINWSKETTSPRTYGFQFSPKLFGKLKRKGLWSPDGSAEIGKRQLHFSSNGRADIKLTITDNTSNNVLGFLNFYWKDFHKSKLELSSGAVFYFKSFNLIKGVWSWIKKDTPNEQFTFSIDSPFQRSGCIEYQATDISTEERDILLLLGLHLTQYINTWLITFIIVIVGVVSGG